jgi:hypothetical protein
MCKYWSEFSRIDDSRISVSITVRPWRRTVVVSLCCRRHNTMNDMMLPSIPMQEIGMLMMTSITKRSSIKPSEQRFPTDTPISVVGTREMLLSVISLRLATFTLLYLTVVYILCIYSGFTFACSTPCLVLISSCLQNYFC